MSQAHKDPNPRIKMCKRDIKWLQDNDACELGFCWAVVNCRTLAEAWDTCCRPAWLMWLKDQSILSPPITVRWGSTPYYVSACGFGRFSDTDESSDAVHFGLCAEIREKYSNPFRKPKKSSAKRVARKRVRS